MSGKLVLARPLARGRRAGHAPYLVGLAVLLAAVLLGVTGSGATAIPPRRVFAALASWAGLGAAADPRDVAIISILRVPRTLMAALAGAILGLSGAVMQGLFRNPLADPGLLGVSAGGAVGAVAAIVFGAALVPSPFRPHAVAVAAFLGALAVTAMVERVASREGRVLVATLLLAGIVFNALAGAATGVLILAADDLQLRDIMFWTMGSCAGADWRKLGIVLVAAAPLLLSVRLLVPGLNALILGERQAVTLGIGVDRLKRLAVMVVACAVGGAVAATGTIGFVGIVAPHLCRLARGADHRWVLPASALAGASLLAAADGAARTVFAPAELPIGIVTALIGGPFFLWLLLRQKARLDGA